jgi:aconitate hydratase
MTDTDQLAREARQSLDTALGERQIVRLDALRALGPIDSLPYTIKVLLESCLRSYDDHIVTAEHLESLAAYDATDVAAVEIPFTPGRVVLQDFTGVPAVVDLAAMRSVMVRMGGDPAKVNPLVACDLVIDHSVQVDAFNSGMALQINAEKEFERNRERYEFLKWGQSGFDNFRVVPPATGIVHQVNLEYLAKVVWDDGQALYPDSLLGTDSHTTMINGLGVLGWGVGGIEAEAVMLGQPIYMLMPEVVGFRLEGELPAGSTATDMVLRVTEMLRELGVVGKFVEFYGPGLAGMPVANRATIANMAPEYGATCGFFPVDERVLEYMWLTGRPQELMDTVETYYRAQGLWRDDDRVITYSDEMSLDLGSVEPALAGPKRPQDRIALGDMGAKWQEGLATTFARDDADSGTGPSGGGASASGGDDTAAGVASTATAVDAGIVRSVSVDLDGDTFKLRDGAVVIAAITSCTNTSNPSVMVGAGLLARNAARRGLQRRPWVKTSLAPGSQVVTDYLEKAGLLDELETMGFYVVGFGCTTCIGNSGPLPEAIGNAVREHDLTVASVLSGNRNFEGRIHADIKANYLASPPLVVAFALAGTVDIDLVNDPVGQGPDGNDVFLHEIWPTEDEIQSVVAESLSRGQFLDKYGNVFEGSDEWKAIATSDDANYQWSDDSTYIQEPTFFMGMAPEPAPITSIRGARCLAKMGDSTTTDHISPAGAIGPDTPAGQYLLSRGVERAMFNSYGSRRGNHNVMTRGTFANVRVRNQLAPDTEGGFTTDFTDGTVKTIFEASESYRAAGTPLVVLGGKDYGMGSSRDWAAKGTLLLGVKAVIATSYERIHRSNLVGMGVLPLTFSPGDTAEALGLDGTETFDIDLPDELQPKQTITVWATKTDRSAIEFDTIVRIDTPVEVDYYRNRGILHTVLRRMLLD